MKKITEYSVAELMNRKIFMIKETDPLTKAMAEMEENKANSLIVDKTHELDAYGIITRKDVVTEIIENHENVEEVQVGDLATKPIVSIQSNVGIKHAIRLMRLAGVRRLAVFEGDELAGMISNGDVYRMIKKIMSAGS